MFTYRGRGGPSRSTPANVTCQKCLKKGHYSYECKASAQERPYISRPSRSQQLRNPKLVPELTNDKPDPLETKQGAADAELAKKEAERARKRERDHRDDKLVDSVSKRRRSVSSDSVSTISTRSSRSPPGKRLESVSSATRPRGRGDASRGRARSRSSSLRSLSRSRSPAQGTRHSGPGDRQVSGSPKGAYRERSARPAGSQGRRRRSYDSSRSRSRSPPPPRHSRSPVRDVNRGGRDLDHGTAQRHGDRHGGRHEGREEGGPPVARREPPRERSLSPFSRRLALTKSMNTGGR